MEWPTRQDVTDGAAPDPLSAAELRRRATGGAALLVARGALILGFGVVANIVLARLLVPRDFGVVALGTVLITIGSFLSDGGLGAGLIRRTEPPARAELEAVNALQIVLTLLLVAIAGAVAVPVGRDGLVIAAMVATLPITILKIPSIIVSERNLQYRPVATTDIVEAVSFYAVALVTVALGMGVWGFAVGMAVRALAGAATMARLGPVGLVRPRWSWSAIRPLLRFGAKFQAVVVVALVRDQGLNIGIAVVAGVSTLGVWNLAWRVLQVPFMVFGTFGRIGYPTMARLLGTGQDPRPVIERGVAALAVVTGALLAGLAGFAPALPAILGHGWGDVPAVLLWAGIAMIASTPVYLGTSGYLFASDAGSTVLATALAGAAVWLAVTLALVSTVGAPAAGIGWCAASILQLAILTRETRRRSGAAVIGSLAGPTVTALLATAAGWLVARGAGGSPGAGVLGLVAGELILLAGLLTFASSALRDTRLLAGDALGSFRGRLGRPRVPLAPAADPAAQVPSQGG